MLLMCPSVWRFSAYLFKLHPNMHILLQSSFVSSVSETSAFVYHFLLG
uniref:Uncharacterized protein n=1 Tax=Arundo donax TaxID=35708 RepID=A0A0A9BKN4_ARUDO